MDQYQTIEILGEGSFGTVFLIADERGKKYALKKIQVNPFKVDEALKQIEVMNKLKHPNLIHIHDSYYDNQDKLEIMMQFCQEGDLLAYYKKNNKYLPVEEIISIFQQIVRAFIAINVKNVIHRDLKPENVFLSKNKIIKIADFGCARWVKEGQFSKIDNFSLDKGTPIYSSPQQLMNEPYSAKCDVWSAGCLLYFLYFGTHPFMDTSVQNTLAKIKKMTEGKQIKIEQNTDLTIERLLKLTLVYSDKNRASWRELHLSRLFKKKIVDIEGFLTYLRSISNIANWVTKQFWRNRKNMNIGANKNEVFAYFAIKFQYTNCLMGVQIIKKSNEYRYLFDQEAYNRFQPKNLKIARDIEADFQPCHNYFKSIKEHMSSKQVYNLIKEKQPERVNCFSDLDNSIRAGYKILLDVQSQLGKKQNFNANELIWVIISRWINFQSWFSFQKNPRVEDFIEETIVNPASIVQQELQKYGRAIIE